MPLVVTCSGCGKRLKAGDKLAGRTVACPQCRASVHIPAQEEEAADYLLKESGDAAKETSEQAVPPAPAPHRQFPTRPLSAKKSPAQPNLGALPPLGMDETPSWLRHLHWLLALALVPLAFSLLLPSDGSDLKSRLADAIDEADPDTQAKIDRMFRVKREDQLPTLDDIINTFPEKRLPGALLPRSTWTHWVFAFGAAILFLAFLLFLAVDGSAQMGSLLSVALFTATVGIIFLFIVQWLAQWSQGFMVIGFGIKAIILWIIKLIGFSYQAAVDPDNGFMLSFIGFTLGVGLCEEVCKAMPLLFHYRETTAQTWRGAFLWGLASGTGFGIAEGIIYSRDFYNGISGADIYVVRFISCVALHALWTGSVGIMLHQKQHWFQQELSWGDYLARVIFIVGIPALLHGLYDTLLKKELDAGALIVAVLSFLYLAFQISQLRGADDEAAQEAMLAEYKRRRAAL